MILNNETFCKSCRENITAFHYEWNKLFWKLFINILIHGTYLNSLSFWEIFLFIHFNKDSLAKYELELRERNSYSKCEWEEVGKIKFQKTFVNSRN